MSIALTLATIVYIMGIIAYVTIGAVMIGDGKDDMHRYKQRNERGILPVEEHKVSDARRRISFGLGIVKGGFIAWPVLLTRSIKRKLREAERYTR